MSLQREDNSLIVPFDNVAAQEVCLKHSMKQRDKQHIFIILGLIFIFVCIINQFYTELIHNLVLGVNFNTEFQF